MAQDGRGEPEQLTKDGHARRYARVVAGRQAHRLLRQGRQALGRHLADARVEVARDSVRPHQRLHLVARRRLPGVQAQRSERPALDLDLERRGRALHRVTGRFNDGGRPGTRRASTSTTWPTASSRRSSATSSGTTPSTARRTSTRWRCATSRIRSRRRATRSRSAATRTRPTRATRRRRRAKRRRRARPTPTRTRTRTRTRTKPRRARSRQDRLRRPRRPRHPRAGRRRQLRRADRQRGAPALRARRRRYYGRDRETKPEL